MTGRTIVFYGNCQALYLQRVFTEQLAPLTGDTAIYLGIGTTDFSTPAHADVIRRADILVDQVFDTPDPLPAELATGLKRRLRIPNLRGDFLWPFGTREPHPNHWQFPKHARKYYGDEMGDSFLNRMVVEKVPEPDAVARYLAVDFVRQRNLQRIYEICLDRQRRRDEIAGIPIADFIDANLRTLNMFSTTGHPRESLLHLIGRPVLAELVGATRAEQALAGQYHAFSWHTAPIHPGVAQQLRLGYITAHTRYHAYDEGIFSFAEYAGRYLRGASVPELPQAITDFGKVDIATTLATVDAALAKAPFSAKGHRFRARVCRDLNRPADAVAAALTAVALEPEETANWTELVAAYLRDGQQSMAEGIARLALAKFPRHAWVYHSLCDVLANDRDNPEFSVIARQARDLHPGNERLLLLLARQFQQRGEAAEAETFLQAARRLHTEAPSPQVAVVTAEVYERQGRRAEAATLLRAALAGGADEAHIHAQLGHVLGRDGDFQGAEAAFRQALARDPAPPGYYIGLADALDRQGRRDEALALFRTAIAAGHGTAGMQLRLGNLLLREGDLSAAEAAFRQALALDPATPAAHHGLADALDRQDRRPEAIAVVRAAIAAGHGDAHVHNRLGLLLARDEDLAGAEAAFRQAVSLAPSMVGFHLSLADAIYRQGRRAEAVALLRTAVAAGHANGILRGRLAHLLAREGDLPAAEAEYRQAVALSPELGGLHSGLAEVIDRQGRRAEAVALLQDFLATGQEDTGVRNRLTQLGGQVAA